MPLDADDDAGDQPVDTQTMMPVLTPSIPPAFSRVLACRRDGSYRRVRMRLKR
jgi:hypothetical protein